MDFTKAFYSSGGTLLITTWFFRTKRIQLQFEAAFLPIPNIQCSMVRFAPDNEEAVMFYKYENSSSMYWHIQGTALLGGIHSSSHLVDR